MFTKFRIKTVLSMSIAILLMLVIVVIVPIVLSNVSSVVGEAEERELNALFNNAKAEIESESKLAEAMSSIVAMTPEVQRALAEGNRDELADRTVPLFKELKKSYGARQFQFHTSPAISFLRAHKPAKWGDDLSSFRLTVVDTNNNKHKVRGLEKGVAGLGIRGISPVFYEGKHVGSVEFGMSFGQAFFDQFKAKYNADIALYIPDGNGFKTFGSTREDKNSLFDSAQLEQVLAGNKFHKQIQLGDTPLAIFVDTITDFSGKSIGVMEISMNRQHYVGAIAASRNSILAVGFLAIVIGLVVAMLLAKSITRPLCEAARAMNEIAQGDGDLTKRLKENGNNEITVLAKAFNLFAEKVRKMIVQVSHSTEQLATSAEEVSSITTETSQAVQKQRVETEQVATAMNEMTATVQEVASHATEAAEAANNADQESKNGQAVVKNTISAIEQLAQDVLSAADVIEQLKKRSDDIGSVLDVIKGIAEQTNLLALNAAIEAARAGEQGRGFAVVADEVRTLASRTQESTEEIQTMIEQLQSGTANAASVMEVSSKKAEEGVTQAKNAGVSLDLITRAVGVINDMNTQIASAAEEQNSVAAEINRNIININDASSSTSEGASQTSVASGELARLSEELRQMVGQFRT